MTNTIHLVTRGDDAGCCAAANRAVAESLNAGVLKNASLMVPGPAFGDLPLLIQGIEGVCLGLHVTLNAEWKHTRWRPILPVDRVPALVDEGGYFVPSPIDLHNRQAPVDQMIAEIQAQLDRAREIGLTIEYVDEHMGVGWLPGLREAIRNMAEREGLAYTPDLPGLKMKSEIADPTDRLLGALAEVQTGTYLLVTHPMFNDAAAADMLLDVPDAPEILHERDAERRFWINPLLAARLARCGIQATRYAEARVRPERGDAQGQ